MGEGTIGKWIGVCGHQRKKKGLPRISQGVFVGCFKRTYYHYSLILVIKKSDAFRLNGIQHEKQIVQKNTNLGMWGGGEVPYLKAVCVILL